MVHITKKHLHLFNTGGLMQQEYYMPYMIVYTLWANVVLQVLQALSHEMSLKLFDFPQIPGFCFYINFLMQKP